MISEAFKEIQKYGLATIALFYSGKGKLHHFPLQTLKGYLRNLKISNVADLLFRKSQYSRKVTWLKVTTQINSEKHFCSKFNKVTKVAGCKITA